MLQTVNNNEGNKFPVTSVKNKMIQTEAQAHFTIILARIE